MTRPRHDEEPSMNPNVNVLLLYPRFQAGSFWNYRETCTLVGAKYPAPPLGLITVAAMLPENWQPRLVDRNTTELWEEELAWADVVFTGGMLPQQSDTLAIIAMCQAAGIPVVVGGPDVTSSPDHYAAADFRVIGEAEGIFGQFVAAFEGGERSGTFEAEKFKADVTTTPVPRFDLLNFSDYVQVNVQFSRGCPHPCTYCGQRGFWTRWRHRDPVRSMRVLRDPFTNKTSPGQQSCFSFLWTCPKF